jgi:putative membrane protein
MKTNKQKPVGFVSLKIMAVICSLALLNYQGARAAENHGQLASSDYKFAVKASQGGQAEVTFGQLAAQKAEDPAVKQFAQRVVDDHTKANQQLNLILVQKGASVPDEKATSSEQKEMNRLQKLSGAEFDKAYLNHMLRDNKKDVKKFLNESDDAKDPDIRTFATTTLPVLQDHLKMAEDLSATVKAEKSGM